MIFDTNLITNTQSNAFFFQPPNKEWLLLHLIMCYCPLVEQLSREESSTLLFLGVHCLRFVAEMRTGRHPITIFDQVQRTRHDV